MDVENILYRSWDVFKENIVAFIVGALIAVIGSILIITIAPLFYGLTHMAVKGIKGEKVEINDVFEGFNHFVRSWVFVLASSILVFIGYLLLVIPGIVLSIMLVYGLPLLVIRGYGGTDAIGESISLSKSNFVDTLVLFIIGLVLNAIGGWIPFAFALTLPFSLIFYSLAAYELMEEYPETEIAGEIE